MKNKTTAKTELYSSQSRLADLAQRKEMRAEILRLSRTTPTGISNWTPARTLKYRAILSVGMRLAGRPNVNVIDLENALSELRGCYS